MDPALPNFTASGLALAFAVTLVAGMATAVGSALAFFARRTNLRLLAWSLAFSGGVMLYVSFVEILPKGTQNLARYFDADGAAWRANLGFFAGLLVMAVIDALVPKGKNPHELRASADMSVLKAPGGALPATEHLWRAGVITALAIGAHNFPEGLVTFLATLEDPPSGIAIGIAIALHNIPEGISVAVPLYFATGRRTLAFALSCLSGLSEPIGGLLAAMTMNWLLPLAWVGTLFAAVAGVMVYISIDVLLPTARQYGHSHEVLAGVTAGMAVMAMSLLLA